MEVAYNLMEPLGVRASKEEFILGSVAPDSVHFSEDYLPKKVHSHIFENCGPWGDTQDYDQWIENIRAFWKKYVLPEKEIAKKALYLGITVHCLTDYWNDLLIWRALQKKMIPPMTYDGFKEEYYPESTRVDRYLFQQCGHGKEILELLINSKEADFEDYLRAKEISKMKDHLINEQYNLPDPIDVSGHKYYSRKMLFEFLKDAANRILEQIKEFGGLSDEEV